MVFLNLLNGIIKTNDIKMTKEKILENNKLIAEFMNLKLYNESENGWRTLISLHYHESWEWLMPVWIKINGLYKCIQIKEDYVKMDVRHKNSLSRTSKYNKYGEIGALYRTVIEFIKWYNQNK